MLFHRYSGADNRFLLIEADLEGRNWPMIARTVCGLESFDGRRADGLLLVAREAEDTFRMVIYNADGTRPEACGNGQRCVGWHLARVGHAAALELQTDVGPRRVELLSRVGDLAELAAEMGAASISSLTSAMPCIDGLISARRVLVGNPHCVLQVEDERDHDLLNLGGQMQVHPDFPEGVNVGFLAKRANSWHLRVWERGVGETAACGTGACAAVATIGSPGEELAVRMRGGLLRVGLRSGGSLALLGDALYLGACELPVACVLETPPASR